MLFRFSQISCDWKSMWSVVNWLIDAKLLLWSFKHHNHHLHHSPITTVTVMIMTVSLPTPSPDTSNSIITLFARRKGFSLDMAPIMAFWGEEQRSLRDLRETWKMLTANELWWALRTKASHHRTVNFPRRWEDSVVKRMVNRYVCRENSGPNFLISGFQLL